MVRAAVVAVGVVADSVAVFAEVAVAVASVEVSEAATEEVEAAEAAMEKAEVEEASEVEGAVGDQGEILFTNNLTFKTWRLSTDVLQTPNHSFQNLPKSSGFGKNPFILTEEP